MDSSDSSEHDSSERDSDALDGNERDSDALDGSQRDGEAPGVSEAGPTQEDNPTGDDSPSVPPSISPLVQPPLPYMQRLLTFAKEQFPETWKWFASHQAKTEQAEKVRFELLKSTYRIDRDSNSTLYELAASVAESLGLKVPITLYLAQQLIGLNASLAFVPDEVHVILHGPLQEQLTEDELRAVLAHELSHFVLFHSFEGDYLVLDQILAGLTHDENADTPHFVSARLMSLYTEIYCDLGALHVCGDVLVVISALVKLMTQVFEIDANAYRQQAHEIFSREGVSSETVSHPESFIRAYALDLWESESEDREQLLAKAIEGNQLCLDELDLIAQLEVQSLTRQLLNEMLSHAWLRTPPGLAHAKLFFDDYQWKSETETISPETINRCDPNLKAYFCYILLDLATSDRELDELPLLAALECAERLGLSDRFKEIAKKELRLRKKQVEEMDEAKTKRLKEAVASEQES